MDRQGQMDKLQLLACAGSWLTVSHQSGNMAVYAGCCGSISGLNLTARTRKTTRQHALWSTAPWLAFHEWPEADPTAVSGGGLPAGKITWMYGVHALSLCQAQNALHVQVACDRGHVRCADLHATTSHS